MNERDLIIDYWNNFRQFDDGLEVFLKNKNLNRDRFYELYYKYVNSPASPWEEDELKN